MSDTKFTKVMSTVVVVVRPHNDDPSLVVMVSYEYTGDSEDPLGAELSSQVFKREDITIQVA